MHLPHLRRGFTIIAKSQDVFSRRQVRRYSELVVDRDVRGPLAGAPARRQAGREDRLVTRGWELEGSVGGPLRGLSQLAGAGNRQGLPRGTRRQGAGGHEVGLELNFGPVGEREAAVASERYRRLEEAILRQLRLQWAQPVLVATECTARRRSVRDYAPEEIGSAWGGGGGSTDPPWLVRAVHIVFTTAPAAQTAPVNHFGKTWLPKSPNFAYDLEPRSLSDFPPEIGNRFEAATACVLTCL